jgi:hypothetical protein
VTVGHLVIVFSVLFRRTSVSLGGFIMMLRSLVVTIAGHEPNPSVSRLFGLQGLNPPLAVPFLMGSVTNITDDRVPRPY